MTKIQVLPNYKIQDGCHNCIHHIEDQEQDGGLELFCNLTEKIDTKIFYGLVNTKKAEEINRTFRGNFQVSEAAICEAYKKIDRRL